MKRVSRKRASERPSHEAPRWRVLARLASLAQIGELARRLNSGYREGWGSGIGGRVLDEKAELSQAALIC